MRDEPAFKNVICHGIVVAADGQKLSKRLRNYPPLDEVFNAYGADILRFFMMNSPVTGGEDVRFSKEALRDVERNVFMTLWNVFSFLVTYAKASDWTLPPKIEPPASENVLDRWMLARLNQTIAEVTTATDAYQLARATRPIAALIDDLSNWYLRRSRRRFARNPDPGDQAAAFATLHFVLVRLCQLLAPWAPFSSDHIYRELTARQLGSVHLSDWPEAGRVDTKILAEMSLVRDSVTEGLAARAAAGIKVRQPLSKATVTGTSDLSTELQELIKDELNVKVVDYVVVTERQPAVVDATITPELAAEGLARDVVRAVQATRREDGLAMGEVVRLELATADATLKAAIEAWRQLICQETSAKELRVVESTGSAVPVRLGDVDLTIKVTKV